MEKVRGKGESVRSVMKENYTLLRVFVLLRDWFWGWGLVKPSEPSSISLEYLLNAIL